MSRRRQGSDGAGDGQRADSPTGIPPRGWIDVVKRVKTEIGEDQVTLMAAGVAFYAMLALVPGLIAAVSVYGLVADPAQLQQQIESMADVLPPSAQQLLHGQLDSLVGGDPAGLSLALVTSVLFALWTASSGMGGLLQAISTVYDETEGRSMVRLRLIALGLTVAGLIGLLTAVGLIAVLPVIVGQLGFGSLGQTLVSLGRWPLLAVLAILGLAVLYRYGPDRDAARWRWVTPGALVGTGLWLTASALFSYYVSNFGNYNETYGSLGAVIVMLLWLFITAFVVLLGAEVNAEMELQTARDTTKGERQPMGERGAHVADHVAGGGDGPGQRPGEHHGQQHHGPEQGHHAVSGSSDGEIEGRSRQASRVREQVLQVTGLAAGLFVASRLGLTGTRRRRRGG